MVVHIPDAKLFAIAKYGVAIAADELERLTEWLDKAALLEVVNVIEAAAAPASCWRELQIGVAMIVRFLFDHRPLTRFALIVGFRYGLGQLLRRIDGPCVLPLPIYNQHIRHAFAGE